MTEIWKDIPNYIGHYQASDTGLIRSVKSLNFKILRYSYDGSGNKTVTLFKDGAPKTKTIHRLIAITFHPNPKNKRNVIRKDEDPENTASSNLVWKDSYDRNRKNRSHQYE